MCNMGSTTDWKGQLWTLHLPVDDHGSNFELREHYLSFPKENE